MRPRARDLAAAGTDLAKAWGVRPVTPVPTREVRMFRIAPYIAASLLAASKSASPAPAPKPAPKPS